MDSCDTVDDQELFRRLGAEMLCVRKRIFSLRNDVVVGDVCQILHRGTEPGAVYKIARIDISVHHVQLSAFVRLKSGLFSKRLYTFLLHDDSVLVKREFCQQCGTFCLDQCKHQIKERAMSTKTLDVVNGADLQQRVLDVKVVGNPDLFQLLSKASSKEQGWMKSTKAMQIDSVGCVVQVTTQQGDQVAEALTFVPGVKIGDKSIFDVEDESSGPKAIYKCLVRM